MCLVSQDPSPGLKAAVHTVRDTSCLEKEKPETKAAKKRIHERLGEKKQQSVAKKAEKAVKKTAKKNKGQEL
jgi:hypothetical protein